MKYRVAFCWDGPCETLRLHRVPEDVLKPGNIIKVRVPDNIIEPGWLLQFDHNGPDPHTCIWSVNHQYAFYRVSQDNPQKLVHAPDFQPTRTL